MKKIFMVCYGGGHVKIISKIYEELKKENNLKIKILALNTAQNYLREKNIPFVSLTDYNKIFNDVNVINLGKNFIEKLNLGYKDMESYLYYGYGLDSLLDNYGLEKIEEGYRKFGRAIFLQLKVINQILDFEKPDLVLTTNSPRMEKATLIVAKEKGIKTISIEDLFGIPNDLNEKLYHFFSNIQYKNCYGDIVCVISSEIKKELTKKIDSQIVVTGNPNFDEIFKNFDKISIIDIPNKYYKILFISQLISNQKEYILRMLQILDKNEDIFLIIKLHPSEKIESYNHIFLEFNHLKNRYMVIENLLYESLKSANLVVTRFSTVAIEANLFQKNVITEKNAMTPFEKVNISKEYESLEEMENILLDLKKCNKFIFKQFITEKNASMKVKDLILENIK